MTRSRAPRFVLVTLTALLAAHLSLPTAPAAKVKVWHYHSPGDYEKAQFKQAVISSEGTLRLSRRLKPFVGLDAAHVWDVVEDQGGNLFVATGDEGKIFKITPAGKVSVAFDSEESQILCLALAPDGSIYAGTGPSGLIIRIRPGGNARVLYDSPATYVWSLALNATGNKLYAGTGPKGRIYELTPDGQAKVFYTTKQEHILSLATGPDGTVYAGTDKNGLVYRITPGGKGFVLYNAPQTEVRSLLVTPDGIYAGTCSPSRHHSGTGTSSGRSFGPARVASGPVSLNRDTAAAQGSGDLRSAVSAGSGDPRRAQAAGSGDPRRAQEDTAAKTSSGSSTHHGRLHLPEGEDKDNGAPAAPPPAAGENSLYRIAFDGTVREVFREKTMVLSLLKQGGRIFIGTGMDGQLFEVDEATKERSEVVRLDHGQVQCLCRRHDGSIVVGTGDPGKLYVLQDRYTASGTVVSEVLDAKIISKWGSIRWHADTPPGTAVTVAVRTGNVAEPDETWSDWSAEEASPQQAVIRAPTARFLQYRVTLTTENPDVTPALHSLALRYMTTNQAPEVTSLEVPDIDSANLDNPKKLKFKWNATDPNEDELTYTLYVRKEGWKNWVKLEEEIEHTSYEWDTTTTPSGIYRVKVVASDRRDNAEDDALTGERISGPFAVAHTPPTVSVKVTAMDGEQAVVEATAADPLVRLTSASFAVNGKKWTNVFPKDGLFDSKTETFRFKTDALKPGTYVLVLKVTDAAGNTGSGDVVFTVKTQAALR
jgi:hypothetical protein